MNQVMRKAESLPGDKIRIKDAPPWWWMLALVISCIVPPVGLCMLLVRYRQVVTVPDAPVQLRAHDAQSEEADHISRRRKSAGIHSGGTVGLALSGGGIRAACFSLGVLRWLEHSEKMREIDYLSSVSGGGYAATSYLYGQDVQDGTRERVSRAEAARERLLRSEGYLETGLGRLLTMSLAFLASAIVSLSPLLLAEQGLFIMSYDSPGRRASHYDGWILLVVFLSVTLFCAGWAWRQYRKDQNDVMLYSAPVCPIELFAKPCPGFCTSNPSRAYFGSIGRQALRHKTAPRRLDASGFAIAETVRRCLRARQHCPRGRSREHCALGSEQAHVASRGRTQDRPLRAQQQRA
ncbi:hypothetical protein J2W46_006882 [Paraburkholderia strydomiana]|nr:hypothetical protein [Paraburkholderia strydomiana]